MRSTPRGFIHDDDDVGEVFKFEPHPFSKYVVSMTTKYNIPKMKGAPPESKHIYEFITENGEKCKLRTSVTGLKSELMPFDKYEVASKLASRYKDRYHKIYGGRLAVEILWMWFEKTSLGTIVHKASEDYSHFSARPSLESLRMTLGRYRSGEILRLEGAPDYIIQYFRESFSKLPEKFRNGLFHKNRAPELLTKFKYSMNYRRYMNKRGFHTFQYFDDLMRYIKAVEVMIFDPDLGLGGLFDDLWYDGVNTWIISDLKCTDKSTIPGDFKKKKLMKFLNSIKDYREVFSDFKKILSERQFWKNRSYVEYAIQLSLYHYIIKNHYRNDTNFKYECNEIHIVRLSHLERNYDLVKFKSDIFEERINRVVELMGKDKKKSKVKKCGVYHVVIGDDGSPGFFNSWDKAKNKISESRSSVKYMSFSSMKNAMSWAREQVK